MRHAVTSQVDMRGWVAGLDDVVAAEDLAVLDGDEEIDTDGDEDNGEEH
jgi:type I restriction enzyme, S subunit